MLLSVEWFHCTCRGQEKQVMIDSLQLLDAVACFIWNGSHRTVKYASTLVLSVQPTETLQDTDHTDTENLPQSV